MTLQCEHCQASAIACLAKNKWHDESGHMTQAMPCFQVFPHGRKGFSCEFMIQLHGHRLLAQQAAQKPRG